MKIYVHDNGVTLVGKAWEIKRKLREYRQEHILVKDWIKTVNKTARHSD